MYCYFQGGPEGSFELFYMELDPHSANTSPGHLAQAQEYITVLEGELTVETGGKSYRLGPGDALGFDSTADHTYRNAGDERVTGLVINYYPG